MRRIIIIIICLLPYLEPACYAQKDISITRPHLELTVNNINIYYNILNSTNEEKFRIWVEITDSSGTVINAQSLYGDLGESVDGGGDNKKITWDFRNDSIIINNGIFVQINAELLYPDHDEVVILEKEPGRGSVILQSALFPGWGLSRIKKGRPHWLKGLAGYGSLAASIIYNRMAVNDYDNYLSSRRVDETDLFYDSSVRNDSMSEIFAYTAVGIWITDLIWTIAGSSELKNNDNASITESFHVHPHFLAGTGVTVLTLRINF